MYLLLLWMSLITNHNDSHSDNFKLRKDRDAMNTSAKAACPTRYEEGFWVCGIPRQAERVLKLALDGRLLSKIVRMYRQRGPSKRRMISKVLDLIG